MNKGLEDRAREKWAERMREASAKAKADRAAKAAKKSANQQVPLKDEEKS
jgi:hypothetical protein